MVIISGILFIFLAIGLVYVIYEHYAAPIRSIVNAKKKGEVIKRISNDPIFIRRINPYKDKLNNGKITDEEFAEIYTELFNERVDELINSNE